MSGNEIRDAYLKFMEERGHAVIPSASLVPENDPTTLFTGSGMQPLVPYLMGEAHPKGTRLTNSQKCFRAEDIDEVGDNRHTTFFEMLGNWSLGDYFKKEQLSWFFEFLTDEIDLDPEKLYVTTFIGDSENNVPKDEESAKIWKELFDKKGIDAKVVDIGSEEDGYKKGMQEGRIFYYDAAKNWWSRAGKPENMPAGEIGGPDSEVFYDFGTEHDTSYGEDCHPNCDCGRFLEIGNSVFMEYIKAEDGSFQKLPKQNVDFGGGLERITAAANGSADVFQIDLLKNVIDQLEKLSGKKYKDNLEAFRIVTDHIRGAVFMIGNGVLPSNTEQGYFVRRLLRRSVRYADKLEIPAGKLQNLAESVIATYEQHYENLAINRDSIKSAIVGEEEQFRKTLERGLREFNELVLRREPGKPKGKKAAVGVVWDQKILYGDDAFYLYQSFGFPKELMQDLCDENDITFDTEGFEEAMKKHQETSRVGAKQKFKGGLADHSDKVIEYHTAHHLLLKALQMVLGEHVKQRGSNITGERLRIDFLHDEKMTGEQKQAVEKIVNEKIAEGLPVVRSTLPKEEAEKLGAEHEFGAKYPDMVSVYSIGPKGASETEPKFEDAFSIEFCGGPHVTNTSDIKGTFRIKKEESSSAGVRRIKAVLG